MADSCVGCICGLFQVTSIDDEIQSHEACCWLIVVFVVSVDYFNLQVLMMKFSLTRLVVG